MYDKSASEVKHMVSSGKTPLCVVGLGYIGIPLAVAFASEGVRVIGFDINKKVVTMLQKGKTPIYEPELSELLIRSVRNKLFTASMRPAVLSSSPFIIITVGTPLNRAKRPNLQYINSACETIGSYMRRNTIVVLKSTVPPLTTEERVIPLLEKSSGLVCNRDFGVAYCPERTVEGRALRELKTLPKIVGGSDTRTTEIVSAVFSILNPNVIKVSTPRVAEMVKLMDNVYRDVNIALANEFARASSTIGVDVMEAIRAANRDYARNNILIPGAGVGGSCLPKDPYILLAATEKANLELKLVRDARSINMSMPLEIVKLIHNTFKTRGKRLRGSKIALLGLAFKSSTNDLRNTPSLPIAKALFKRGVTIYAYDPYVISAEVNHKFGNIIKLRAELLDACMDTECVAILTDHPEFYTIDLKRLKSVMKYASIVDGRHVINPLEAIGLGFVYEGIGRPSRYFHYILSGRGN